MSNFVSAAELDELLGSETPVRVIDVRWRLDRPDGHAEYLAGHIPGAVFVPLATELATHGEPSEGRHPLPSTQTLQDAARRWGVNQGDLVVAYDDAKGLSASRAWWLLRQGGVDVRVLDGGIRAWISAGLPIASGDAVAPVGSVHLLRRDPGVASIDDAARAPVVGSLVDVRSPEHYRGNVVGLDPAAGHIPGALNVPTVSHVTATGSLRSADEIRDVLEAAGVDAARPVVLYCGVGIASAHSALAFAQAGIETRVYTGAWSQWSREPGRPVAVGRTPADAFQGW